MNVNMGAIIGLDTLLTTKILKQMENFKFWLLFSIIIIGIILLIALPFLIIYNVSTIATELQQECDSYKENIGNTVVVNKDTLQIIDVSCFRNVYILDNKSEVNIDAINKFIINH